MMLHDGKGYVFFHCWVNVTNFLSLTEYSFFFSLSNVSYTDHYALHFQRNKIEHVIYDVYTD